jgi:hypothetical protein
MLRHAAAALALIAAVAASARAEDAQITAARTRFLEGAELVKRAQWSEALAAFEESARLRPHAITTYNIGACERAMGRYVRARATLERALADSAAAGNQLPASLAGEAKNFITEIEGLLVHIDLTVDPPEAMVAVDGHAAAAPSGPGEWRLTLDPGVHIFTFHRQGFADAAVNKTYVPGASVPLQVQLDRLPATLHLACNRAGAVATVDGTDVGIVPVDVQRPAGSYEVAIAKPGFVTLRTHLTVRPGEAAQFTANLEEKRTPIYKKWWFWSIAAVVVVGASVGGYFAAHANDQPPLDGGGLQWTVKLR